MQTETNVKTPRSSAVRFIRVPFSGQTLHQSEACYTHILSHAEPHIHSCHMQSTEKAKSKGLQHTKKKKQSRYAKDKLRLVDNELKAAKASYYQSSSNKRNSKLSTRTRLLRAGLYLSYFYFYENGRFF